VAVEDPPLEDVIACLFLSIAEANCGTHAQHRAMRMGAWLVDALDDCQNGIGREVGLSG
jgi:hypothetical protein